MEGGSDGSPPQSLCMIRAAELFPKPQMEKEDTQLSVPFQELAGESVKYLGRTDDGVLALSNYRIFLLKNSTNSETSVPLGLIESAQSRDLFHLIINCKDASTVKCSFETAEQCSEWQRRIQLSIGVPETLETLFAFPFYSWICDNMNNTTLTHNGYDITSNGNGMNGIENPPSSVCSVPDYSDRLQRASPYEDDFMREVERLGFNLNGSWRISTANKKFKLCPSYPEKILVPYWITDEILLNVANFRGSRRLPAVVWRHQKSGAVIARCSQPEVGWLGWRNSNDEQLLKALADACASNRGEQLRRFSQAPSGQTLPSGDSSPVSPDNSHEEVTMEEVKKILIVDARSYTSAVTNRARGGGCECIEYYPCAEIEFMNLGNIHVIRKSFHALRQLCASPPDVPNWLGLLEKTMWLQHLSGLLAASMTVCHAIEKKGRPVLVHCSDGWDRTPQIVATAQLCLDPFYRTVEGFRILVEREWLSYGHKFADRCGHGPGSDELNERCPVFLQWLDLVHQIHKQFPCSFEFSMGYLIKLAQHSHSCLFGTFLCNTLKERIDNTVFERTFSVWPFLSGSMYRNPLYVPNREKVLWPAYNVRDLSLWTEVYLGSLGNQGSIDYPGCNNDGLNGSISPMAKTRSYGDLITAGCTQNGISRRSSDPNMTVDPSMTIGSNSENESIADIQSEREDSPELISNIIHDTTKKLTIEHNKHFGGFPGKPPQNLVTGNIMKTYDETMQQLLSEGRNSLTSSGREISSDSVLNGKETNDNSSNILENNFNENGCDLKSIYGNREKISVDDAVQSVAQKNGFYQYLNSPSNGRIVQETISGVTIEKADNMNLAMIQSVDLGDPSASNGLTPLNGLSKSSSNNAEIQQDLWHGSVNTSTDTLVPIETKQCSHASKASDEESHVPNTEFDETDSGYTNQGEDNNMNKTIESAREDQTFITKTETLKSTNYNILPKVHSSSISISSSSSNSTYDPTLIALLQSSSDMHHNVANQYNQGDQDRISDSGDDKNDPLTTINPAASATVDSPTVATTASMTSKPNDITQVSNMEESILIFPEHQKLEISISGKCESVEHSVTPPNFATPISGNMIMTTNVITPATNPIAGTTSYAMYGTAYGMGVGQTRRRRTSSSNSRRDGAISKQTNGGGTFSRFSMTGMRSLPMTPPGLPDRPQIAISCPDGLAHALSEQNIRLQQIVHEHKLREDVLLREIHDMRMALLKKTCPHCNSAPATNDEQVDEFVIGNRWWSDGLCKKCMHKNATKPIACQRRHRRTCCPYRRRYSRCGGRHKYQMQQKHPHGQNCVCINDNDVDDNNNNNGNDDDDDYDDDNDDDEDESGDCCSVSACSALDNAENVSICSWEAVEDRSGPSSCASSSIHQNASSVLWVPDHAVSRCTNCQTEFWLGRRKHHCRSCGQIFCADCSEFWAPLPDEKLFSPVRLCGPCYHSVTTRMQQHHQPLQQARSLVVTATSSSGNMVTNPLLINSVPLRPRGFEMAPVLLPITGEPKDNFVASTRASQPVSKILPSPLEACNQAAAMGELQHHNHHRQNQCVCATGMDVTSAATN